MKSLAIRHATSTMDQVRLRKCGYIASSPQNTYAGQYRALHEELSVRIYVFICPMVTRSDKFGLIERVARESMESNDELDSEKLEVVACSEAMQQRVRTSQQNEQAHGGTHDFGPTNFV